jgi:hypothetical protein
MEVWVMKTLCSRFAALLVLTVGLAVWPHSSAADSGTKIASWENWIRYDCDMRDARDLEQARKNFRAVVRTATAAPRSDVYGRFADLADIEGATFLAEEGELVIWGPKIGNHNFMPPLLWDDFVTALRIVHFGRNPTVSIGTYAGRIPTKQDMEEARRTGIIPVEYGPALLANTHAGAVLFEADRWLKALAIGVDNFTGERVRCPVRADRSTTARAELMVTGQGMRPFGRNWFMPDEPQVAVEAYSMRFGRCKMRVKNEIYTSDAAPRDFAQEVEDDFDEYCKYYAVFRELVRLFKVVQVARWYSESGFPVQPILDAYEPLPVRTMATTKQKAAKIGRRVVGNRVYWGELMGGVVFSAPNNYLPASAVPAQRLAMGTPSTWGLPDHAAPAAPVRFGSLPANAPVPVFVTQVIERRPTVQTTVWTIPVRGMTYLAAAIPIPSARARNMGLDLRLPAAPRLFTAPRSTGAAPDFPAAPAAAGGREPTAAPLFLPIRW